MKYLRKLTALLLAVVLAFSLAAAAGAANVSDYTDAEDVTCSEAVDLFTALGFLDGMDDGAFNPQGLVTREQAAKLITYMLIGSSRADALTAAESSFTDVLAGRWSAPFIEYCATLGLVNGRGDGTFDPNGGVTSLEFAKMLLRSLGYGANGEYTGDNWAMTTLADAAGLGILSLELDYSAPATREACAQYGFNAYTLCDTVVWNSTTQAYQQAVDIDGQSAKGNLAGQQGVEKSSRYILNGATYYKWQKNGVELTGDYTVDKLLGTSTDGASIAELTDPASSKYIASLSRDKTGAIDAKTYYNGIEASSFTPKANGAAVNQGQIYLHADGHYYIAAGPAANNAADHPADIAKGVIVKLFSTDTDADAESVSVTVKCVATLSGAPVVSKSTDTVTISELDGCVNQPLVKVPGYSELKAKDVVLWYKDSLGVYNVEKAPSVTGSVAQYVSGASNAASTVTVGNKTYNYSGLAGTLGHTAVENSFGITGVTFYFDDGGYLVYAVQKTEKNPAADYLFCLDQTTAGYDAVAKAVLSNGSTAVITVDPTGDAAATKQFFRFVKTSDGAYKLTAVADDGKDAGSETQTGTFYNDYSGDSTKIVTITRNTVHFLAKTGVGVASLSGSNKTVFLYQKTATSVSAYTGLNAVPSYVCDAAAEKVYALYTDGAAIMVYAVGGTASSTTTAGDWVYIANGAFSVSTVGGTTIYTYRAVVNGNPGAPGNPNSVTVNSTNDATTFNGTVGLYKVTKYDSDGYVTEADNTPSGVHHYGPLAGDTLEMTSGNIRADGIKWYVLNSSAHIFLIDSSTIPNAPDYDITFSEPTDVLVNALDSTGATIDFVETSYNTTIATVYIYV